MLQEARKKKGRWIAAGSVTALAALGLLAITTTTAQATGTAHGTSTTTDVANTGACLAPPRALTDPDPTNCNAYADKADVWLSGLGSGGVPDGTYFFEVVSPGDQNNLLNGNLSTDAQDPERTFTVANGIVSYGGTHGFDAGKIQIGPLFSDTSNPGGVYILAICPVGGGNCKYDAFKVKSGDGTGGAVEVPVVTKDADGSYDLTYAWDVTKSVDKTKVEQVGGTATFNYTLSVHHDAGTPSNVTVTGTIDVFNPNADPITGVDVTDSITVGTTPSACTVTGGSGVTLNPGTNFYDYECDLAAVPVGDVSNTATATWDGQDVGGVPLAAGHADFLLTPITLTASPVDRCVDVTDVFNLGTPDSEGVICVTDPDVNPQLIHYSRNIPVPASGCLSYDNKATATGQDTGAAVDSNIVTVQVCGPVKTGALTIGFWQNKNGQAIVTSGSSTSGVCKSGTWLRQYAPFQDLSATANCTVVAKYVSDVIKAASAAGAAMNAMLKAQMLATALDVYFSDPLLGTNKIGAPAPIGSVSIDLTKVCKNIAICSIYENTSGAFGGATSLTVSQLLAYAGSQSNAGGTAWYGQVKATQELAKDTFDAINNQVAFGA